MKLIDYISYILIAVAVILKSYALSIEFIQEYTTIIIVVFSAYWILASSREPFRKMRIFRLFELFSLIIGISTIISLIFNDISLCKLLDAFLFPFLFVSSYAFFSKYPSSFKYIKYLGIILICVAFWNVQRLSSIANQNVTEGMVQSNSGNLLVALIPFVCLWEKKEIKYGLWIVILIGICISLKRSAFIIYLSCLFFVFFLSKGRRVTALTILFVCVCAVGIVHHLSSTFPFIEILLNRLSMVFDDGGSGRDVLFLRTWNLYLETDLINQIFGNGFLSVSHNISSMYNIFYSSAHNDILEILYDYGALGLLVFVLICHEHYRMTKETYNDLTKGDLFNVILCCDIIYVVAICMICTIVHYWYYLPMYCLWGATYAQLYDTEYES